MTIENNKLTDCIVAQTVKRNIIKYNFDKAYTIYVNNATLIIDTEGGRIAYISNLNPWKFQLISAEDIDDIKNDHGKGRFHNTTHYVYFQFSYQGKVMKFATFTSRRYWAMETDMVQNALKKAVAYADILREAKQMTLYERVVLKNLDLQKAGVEQETQTNVTQTNEIQPNEKAEKFNRVCGRWMFRIAGIILCVNVLCRIVDAGKSMEYVQVTGTVTMTQTTKEWVRAGNRSREMPRYHVWIEYPVQEYGYSELITETYHENIFSKGDTVPVLYRRDAAYKAYAAKKDWMTGAYLPLSKWYNVPLIIAGVLFVISFLLYKNEVDFYAYAKYFIAD